VQLFVIRHATAVPRDSLTPDAARPLTPKGRQRWKRGIAGLDRLGIAFDRLYHSPWLRAVETADALRHLVHGETVVTRELARRPTPALLEQLEGDRIALVGHQPWLGELVGSLVFKDARDGARLTLKKGSVVWLEGEPRPGAMTIRALLPSRALRALRLR
jgi:phosphohistidine phosphatase